MLCLNAGSSRTADIEKTHVMRRVHIMEIPKSSNVSCKISGLVAYADPARWTVADLRPFVDHVIATFGWDHVLC